MIGLGLAGAAGAKRVSTVVTPPPPPPPDPDPGGGTIFAPRTNLPGMQIVFNKDFTNDAPVPEGSFMQTYGNIFGNYADGTPDTFGARPANAGTSMYHQNTLSVGPSLDPAMGNVLRIRQRVGTGASNPAHNNRPWGAALRPRVPGNTHWSFNTMLYGRMQIGVRCWRAVPGFKTAWLTWPSFEPWPQGGELDFPEGSLNGGFRAFFHRDAGTSAGDQDIYPPTSQPAIPWIGGWHETATHWAPNFAQAIRNGVVVGTQTARVPNQAMHWVIQCERNLGGSVSSTGDCLIEISYVTLWRWTG